MQTRILAKIMTFMLVFMIATYLGTGASRASAQPVRGNPLAPVTIIEYTDFQCSTCARMKLIVDQVLEKYNGQVNLELRHKPLDVHPFAMSSARIFEALYRQNETKAWRFYDLVMANQAVLKTGNTGLQYLVDQLDLTPQEKMQFSLDLRDPAIDAGITATINEANSLRLCKVPSFLINGTRLENYDSPDDFFKIIDQLLQQDSSSKGAINL